MAELIDPISKTKEEAAFINGLYDDSLNKQKQTLSDNLTQNAGALDAEKKSVQQQTQTHQQRTDVEAQKGAQRLNTTGLSSVAQQQSNLSLDNQLKKDKTALQSAQDQADAEIERQRKLLASQYESAIKEAQANNDMARAQQLYNAAKVAEDRLREYRQNAGNTLAGAGDLSIVQSLYELTDAQKAALQNYSADTAGDSTVPDQLKSGAEALRKIYDASLEAQNQKLQSQYEQDRSDLEAKQKKQQLQTDKNLTQAYVDALKQGKNYNEVQTAYGMGSGTKAQANLARETGLQDDLTELRKLQMGYDAQSGQDSYSLLKSYLANREAAQTSADKQYNEGVHDAYADRLEQDLAAQEAAGNVLAQNGDYSALGKLWGLSSAQISRLGGGGSSSSGYSGRRSSGTGKFGSGPELLAAELKAMQNAAKSAYKKSGGSGGSTNTPTRKNSVR